MRPVLIDTNAFSALKKGDSDNVEIIQYAEVIWHKPWSTALSSVRMTNIFKRLKDCSLQVRLLN